MVFVQTYTYYANYPDSNSYSEVIQSERDSSNLWGKVYDRFPRENCYWESRKATPYEKALYRKNGPMIRHWENGDEKKMAWRKI